MSHLILAKLNKMKLIVEKFELLLQSGAQTGLVNVREIQSTVAALYLYGLGLEENAPPIVDDRTEKRKDDLRTELRAAFRKFPKIYLVVDPLNSRSEPMDVADDLSDIWADLRVMSGGEIIDLQTASEIEAYLAMLFRTHWAEHCLRVLWYMNAIS